MGNGKNYNAGIDVLKVLACIGVVLAHFGRDVKVATLSVPIFMFVSAYLCGRLFTEGSWKDLFSRLKRLYIPFFAWGIIYYLALSVVNKDFDICVLGSQLMVGAPACPVLYFLFLLMCYSVILFVIAHIRLKFVVLFLLFAACLLLQYSGLNVAFFSRFNFDLKMVLGRFVELFPPAIMGLIFFLVEKSIKRSDVCCVIACIAIVFYCISISDIFVMKCTGFSYQGLPLLIGAVGISVLVLEGFGCACVRGSVYVGGGDSLCRSTYSRSLLHPFDCWQNA